ncbi:MAG: hypothetical protein INQ03_16125 [Candidatus Heimdallarchaeota archaeon]|nr:hypothetical protein [Candidatus Heimdallarchaeota archaeon]
MRILVKHILVLLVISTVTAIPQLDDNSWTLMIYLDGDNDLEDFALQDINEMEMIGSSADLNIIVLLDTYGEPGILYEISKDTNKFEITSKILVAPEKLTGEINMGDPEVMKEFISYCQENYVTDYYALVLWDHGSGWSDYGDPNVQTEKRVDNYNRYEEEDIVKGICFDDTDLDVLTQNELQSVLSTYPVDILGFDACLMGYLEIAYDFIGLADYLVFSQETEPGDGWPYDEIISYLDNNPAATVETVASTIAEIYVESYTYGSQGSEGTVTMSAIATAELSGVDVAVDALIDLMLPNMENYQEKIENAFYAADSYTDPTAIDFIGFLTELKIQFSTDTDIVKKIDTILTLLGSAVVNNDYGIYQTNTNGLSIYFPHYEGEYDQNYNVAVDWSESTKWDTFVYEFSIATGGYLDDAYIIDQGQNQYTISSGDAHLFAVEIDNLYHPQLLEVQLSFDESDDFDLYLVNNQGYIISYSVAQNPEFVSYIFTDEKIAGIIIHAYSGSGNYVLEFYLSNAPYLSGTSTGNVNEGYYATYTVEIGVVDLPILMDLTLSFSTSYDFDLYVYSNYYGLLGYSEGYTSPEVVSILFAYNDTLQIYVYAYQGSGSYSLTLELEEYQLASVEFISTSSQGLDSNSDSTFDMMEFTIEMSTDVENYYYLYTDYYIYYADYIYYFSTSLILEYIEETSGTVVLSTSVAAMDLILDLYDIPQTATFTILAYTSIIDENYFILDEQLIFSENYQSSDFDSLSYEMIESDPETGTLSAGQYVYYAIDVDSGDEISISLTGDTTTDFDFSVIDMTMTTVLYNSAELYYPETAIVTAVSTGIVLIMISGFSGEGEYQLSVEVNGEQVGSNDPGSLDSSLDDNGKTDNSDVPVSFFTLLAMPILNIIRKKK